MGNIIELKNVDAGYGKKVILSDVSFSIARGEIFALLGNSGCGKSTIMKHMIGLNPILAGSLTVAGEPWTHKTKNGLYKRIGVMYQSGALFGSMTCLENVMLPLEEYSHLSKKELKREAMRLLAEVELAEAASKMPSEISGGMRKRVAIARAMALRPEVVFLDEPSAGLDPVTSSSLDELILSLREKFSMTFVIVTHELPSIFKIVDRAAFFDGGRKKLLAVGRIQELAGGGGSDDDFIRCFFERGRSHGFGIEG